MDKIEETPKLSKETNELVEEANKVYLENFDGNVWFGRCIFLSWYCERGTCDFCFRSTQKHKIKHAEKARRSLPSVLSEAALINGLNWRLEFLTGGYGIYPFEEIERIIKLCSQVLKEKIWLNLGVLEINELKKLKDNVGGIVSSLETLEPRLHNKVCPDKPLDPYFDMIKETKDLGFKQSITLVIGLGEQKEDFEIVKKFLQENNLDRITIYALRPVQGTPYTHGPKTEDLCWWISKVRINFPNIEIITGTARYRIPEISLLLKAGSNGITKLPATNIFNKQEGKAVELEVKKAGRNFISKFTSKDIRKEANWEELINQADLTKEEKEKTLETLNKYLDKMSKIEF